ncbi:MAG: GatB/YqeY domain-containing protein [Ruminiclostridium sp.]|nr:GatB/YqeY domain-containing protein [Ruminiclostridium sp.]
MSLKERLLEDMKVAMRDKDVIKKNTVQMARAAILQVEKDSRVTLDDDGVLDIIAKEVKKRRESLPEFEKSGRQELIDNLKTEIEVLLQYLPQQLTGEELELIVRQAVQDTGASSVKDMGRIMQEVMPKVKGRADGRIINQIAKKILG